MIIKVGAEMGIKVSFQDLGWNQETVKSDGSFSILQGPKKASLTELPSSTKWGTDPQKWLCSMPFHACMNTIIHTFSIKEL